VQYPLTPDVRPSADFTRSHVPAFHVCHQGQPGRLRRMVESAPGPFRMIVKHPASSLHDLEKRRPCYRMQWPRLYPLRS
jgi:hypothetical protein